MAINIRRSPALLTLFIFLILELTALHSSTNSALVGATPTPPSSFSNTLSKQSSSLLSAKQSRGQVAASATVVNNNNNNNINNNNNNRQKNNRPALGGRRRRPQNNGRNPFLMQNFELSGHDGSHQDLAHALGIVVKKKDSSSTSALSSLLSLRKKETAKTARKTEPKHGVVKAQNMYLLVERTIKIIKNERDPDNC
ncbi:hypothetical protein EDD21DRAFT_425316 [Dissophora ornata]|nr:hypothetical protein EDD21DRAFT_425316 [Dissophora ornata]